ncbi:LysR family transcriptional regulator [Thalassotalea insulae]|uniref:LysR family transcriptional regulator n=1 Tax=Thalassotalea insulae TaxID=2056778 RepID=A0ABQ6GWF9_9GAMM|nr:LysR family transcriptional regulator [Thalassotalea insulae]GLX80268.1 LysR family transcriptional regulator [Thalassotalea insulae]
MRRENDKFHLMKVFHEVANNGSFTQAAKSLGMTTSSVSKAVHQLENSLQAKLLNRTTRNQSLTDSGRQYLNTAKLMLGQLQSLEENIKNQTTEASGLLRITMPSALGQFFIAPKLHTFKKAYPKVQLDLVLNEHLVDITEQGFDIAIRSVELPATSPLYSVQLGQHQQKLVASPEYLKQYGLLNSPEQLSSHQLLVYQGPQIKPDWSLYYQQQLFTIQPDACFSSNNYYALLMAAKNGLGIANLYQYMVDSEIKAGNLVHILPNWQQSSRKRYAVYQQRRETSAKLDRFIAFTASLFD